MNHKYMTLGIAAIIAAMAVTAVGFAVPQQAFAHYHNNNGIKVDQQITQVNDCNGTNTTCANEGSNSADIDR